MTRVLVHVFAPIALEAAAVRFGAPGLRVERSGMGPERARRAAQRHDPHASTALAVAGLCGALDPELPPGAVFVPEKVRAPDGAVRTADGLGLCAALRARGIEAHGGTLLGADHIVTGEERRRMFETGARAVDMETPWLAAAAGDRPFAVLRVVIDGPHDEVARASFARRSLRGLRILHDAAPALADWARGRAQDLSSSASQQSR